jgi:hypothetical protein
MRIGELFRILNSRAWNLDYALSKNISDFFVFWSSLTGLLGNLGQANHASANTPLGSFVQYRHNLGLPCSVIDLGGVEGVEVLNDNQKYLTFKINGKTSTE